jgi:co-chaperonin GroES (HSP10)
MATAKKLIPLLNRVLVQKIVAPAKSGGGVLLPESASASKVSPFSFLYFALRSLG